MNRFLWKLAPWIGCILVRALLTMAGMLALSAAALLSGCATTQVYPGAKLSAEHVARVDGTIIFFGVGETTVLIKSIDGVERLNDADVKDWDYVGDLELLPGEHTLGVQY